MHTYDRRAGVWSMSRYAYVWARSGSSLYGHGLYPYMGIGPCIIRVRSGCSLRYADRIPMLSDIPYLICYVSGQVWPSPSHRAHPSNPAPLSHALLVHRLSSTNRLNEQTRQFCNSSLVSSSSGLGLGSGLGLRL